MANEALIKVNGVALSTPSDIKVEIQDLDGESVRPVATGVLRRNRIRSNSSDCKNSRNFGGEQAL